MNITGVTQTTQVFPQDQMAQQPQAVSQAQEAEQTTASGADMISTSMAISVQVLDMAQSSFEDAANRLLESMAAATGIGQNIDLTV